MLKGKAAAEEDDEGVVAGEDGNRKKITALTAITAPKTAVKMIMIRWFCSINVLVLMPIKL